MNSFRQHVVVVVAIGLACLHMIGHFGLSMASSAPIPKESPEREVRLDAIYTLGPQVELKRFSVVKENPSFRDLVVIQASLERNHVSNLFLVRGDDIAAAVRDTRTLLTWDRPQETPGEKAAREKSKVRWLFLYLGPAASTPNKWKIQSVGVFKDAVKVFYTTEDLTDRIVTADVEYYCYWIPLGALNKLPDQMQLVDQPTRAVVLMRKTGPVRGAEKDKN